MAAGDDSAVALSNPTGNTDTRLTSDGDHRQVVALGNAGDVVVGSEPWGALNVSQGASTLFVDPWAGAALDTTDRWTVAAGGAPTVSGGNMTMPATAATYNAIASKANMPYTLGYQYLAMGITLEASAAIGAGRFWGIGTYTASPSATKLVTDGIGFEIDQATGNLLAVTYNAGVRTTIATLTRPSDGDQHRYALHWRPTQAYWFIDGLQVPVASKTWPDVPVQELPVLIVRQNAGSFTGTPVFTNVATAVGDTNRLGEQIVDGTYPWRKASVGSTGALGVGGVSGGSTSGAIAAGATGTVGPLDVSKAGNVSFIAKNTTAASAWAGAPVLVFEQSDDNVSWSPLMVARNDTGAIAATHVLGANTANTSIFFEAAMEAVNYVRCRVTTGPTTNGMTIVINTGTMPFNPIAQVADRKDGAARTTVSLYAANVTAGASGTEAMVTLTQSKGTAATSSGTTYALGAGKTLRITGIRFQHVAGAATANNVNWRLRLNTAGAVTTASTPILIQTVTRGPATANAVSTYDIPIGEGMEIANPSGGTVNIGISQTPTWTTTALTFDVHLVAYEY